MGITGIAARALDLLFPPTCAACGLPGDPLCAACRTSLSELVEAAACVRCGHPWEVPTEHCSECPAGVDATRQAVVYDPLAQAVVSALKDDHRRHVAGEIARIMCERIPRPPPGVVLVAVPLAPSRQDARGFNQSALLAQELGNSWARPVADVLRRVTDGPPQRGASVTARRLQVRGAFEVRDDVEMPRAVCLVDDVITTGATVSACARALRRRGVAAVGAVAFARVIRFPHALP
jgi:ComF family protein